MALKSLTLTQVIALSPWGAHAFTFRKGVRGLGSVLKWDFLKVSVGWEPVSHPGLVSVEQPHG